MLIPRSAQATVAKLAQGYPIVAITGPRQSGKTTLARTLFADKPYVSLEDLDERDLADRDPEAAAGRVVQGWRSCPGGRYRD